MIVIGPRRDTLLKTQLELSHDEEVTYPEVGLTRSSTLPLGYRHDRLSLHIGPASTSWDWARTPSGSGRLMLTPEPRSHRPTPPVQGATVLASRTVGPITILAPCRVVYITDQPTRFGVVYGTLPGHPEQGEEAFHVVLGDDGSVTAEIVAFSKPDDLSTKLAGPMARKIGLLYALPKLVAPGPNV